MPLEIPTSNNIDLAEAHANQVNNLLKILTCRTSKTENNSGYARFKLNKILTFNRPRTNEKIKDLQLAPNVVFMDIAAKSNQISFEVIETNMLPQYKLARLYKEAKNPANRFLIISDAITANYFFAMQHFNLEKIITILQNQAAINELLNTNTLLIENLPLISSFGKLSVYDESRVIDESLLIMLKMIILDSPKRPKGI